MEKVFYVAKNSTRVMSLILAIVFALSTLAVSVGVVLLIKQDQKQRLKEDVQLKAIQDKQNQANGTNAIPPEPSQNNEESGKKMQGTKLENFEPVAQIAQLQIIDITPGNGEEVKPGATVTAHYTGAVAKDGVIFQSSHDQPGDQPVEFPLSGVIKGWTDGVPGMKVGGKRRLLIPAALAYGETPPPNSGIPPNADLVFDIELVKVSQ